jgi:hypothetical protein
VRNKAHLVAQGFSQVEGLYFGETFAPVARLEAIRILLAFATSKGFILYQIDMKSAFLNGVIQEEVYVWQPPGFGNPKYPDRVYKLSMALYGLKQALWAWYARLKIVLLEHGYVMGCVDNILFTLNQGTDILLVQIYVDGIILVALLTLSCPDFRKRWRLSSCHTPFRDSRNEASIRVPRMFHSHI